MSEAVEILEEKEEISNMAVDVLVMQIAGHQQTWYWPGYLDYCQIF